MNNSILMNDLARYVSNLLVKVSSYSLLYTFIAWKRYGHVV